MLDRLGPLDERYFNHDEDLDYCMRALDQGLWNFTCAESVAHHWESQSGPARFARTEASDARFWSRWGGRYHVDLGRFVDEGLDHVLAEAPHLAATAFQVLDLSRGDDQPVVLERLYQRWTGLSDRHRHYRQMDNPASRLWLSLLVPHWVVNEPTPFIYVVDRYRELEENSLWFDSRRRVVEDELIVDLNAVVVRTSATLAPTSSQVLA